MMVIWSELGGREDSASLRMVAVRLGAIVYVIAVRFQFSADPLCVLGIESDGDT